MHECDVATRTLKLRRTKYCISAAGKLNTLSANFTKWSDTLKQFLANLPTNCLSVFNHFVELALKELRLCQIRILQFSFLQKNV